MADNLTPEEFINKGISNRELKGIYKAIDEHKKQTLKLHKMPMSSDCAMEIIQAEQLFRKSITHDIRTLVELNCANCPAGYTREDCQAKACPFKSIDQILKDRLTQLNEILPGGI